MYPTSKVPILLADIAQNEWKLTALPLMLSGVVSCTVVCLVVIPTASVNPRPDMIIPPITNNKIGFSGKN